MKHRLTKKDILTIPNALSLFRLLLIPVIVYLYGVEKHRYAAVGVVALSGLTDMADGYIARHFNMVSDVGKILDPIADKLTQAALLICLADRYRVLYWVFALFCLKEVLQGLMGLLAIRTTGEVQAARWYGKVSTGVFYGTMLLLLLIADMPETWANALIGVCAAALAMAMLLYIIHYLGLCRGKLKKPESREEP
ncbi:MAG: CDP-alcohol phosphatidyltransferase family protein [Oscillospiraceae bacterium]